MRKFFVRFKWSNGISNGILVEAINGVLAVRQANDAFNANEQFVALLTSHKLRLSDATEIHVEASEVFAA